MPSRILALFLPVFLSTCGDGGEGTGGIEPASLGLGEPCVFDGTMPQPCKPGLWCSGENSCEQGYCMLLCEVDSDCPAIHGPSQCKSWDGYQPDVCVYHCSEALGDPCPAVFAQELACVVTRCAPPDVMCEE